jgi:FkbM family methyltransferase
MNWLELLCCHAGPIHDDAQRTCCHPQLTGLKIVSPDQCRGCSYRNVPVEPAAWSDGHAVARCDCAWLASTSAESAHQGASPAAQSRTDWLNAELLCSHPAHRQTTRRQCAACFDYLFPVISPRSPISAVRDLFRLSNAVHPERWWTWPNVREAFRQLTIEAIDNLESYPGGFSDRGIVILGGGKYFASAYVTIRVLRRVGCRLPIQLWHLSEELTAAERVLVTAQDVECVDGEARARQTGFPLHATWWKGWQLKPFAIIHAPFREILYLDADCYPTRDPTFLFSERRYLERGAVFWPDLEGSSCLFPREATSVFGIAPFEDLPAESGQILIHKEWCWRELNLALFYNAHADYTYRVLWGDKDTFPIAWKRLGREYARLWPTAAHTPQALLQFDGEGQVIFQHRASDKFRRPGTQFDSNTQSQPANSRNPQLVHEDFCFGVVEELSRWIATNVSDKSLDMSRTSARMRCEDVGVPSWPSRADFEAYCRARVTAVPVAEHQIICRVLGGPVLIVDPRDKHISSHLAQDGFWEAWITTFLARWLKPGMHCVDVGANYGYYTALFAERCSPSGRVVAVEPQPAVAASLRASVKANGWRHVTVEEVMIGDRSGKGRLWCADHHSLNASFRKDLGPPDAVPVDRDCVALGDLVGDWPRLDLVKINAEGAERSIWDGAVELLQARRSAVVLEYRVDRYEDPGEFITAIRSLYPHVRAITFEGELGIVTDDDLLQGRDADWMLFLHND